MSDIYAHWDGEAFRPLPRHHNELAARLVIGERYRLGVDNERSMASHRQEFASLKEAWMNLPEDLASQYDNEEHFRKRALIATGWHTQREYVCTTRAEAERWIKVLRSMDTYAVFSLSGTIIVARTARSQSVKAMGKADFQRSKQDVLDWAWSLCGISPETARREAGRAA